MFGFVIDEIEELMLLLIFLVYGLVCKLIELCKINKLDYLCFDVKI